MTTLAAFPKWRNEERKKKMIRRRRRKSMSSRSCRFHGASFANGNAFIDGKLQVEIFFLIIGHP